MQFTIKDSIRGWSGFIGDWMIGQRVHAIAERSDGHMICEVNMGWQTGVALLSIPPEHLERITTTTPVTAEPIVHAPVDLATVADAEPVSAAEPEPEPTSDAPSISDVRDRIAARIQEGNQ